MYIFEMHVHIQVTKCIIEVQCALKYKCIFEIQFVGVKTQKNSQKLLNGFKCEWIIFFKTFAGA